MSKIKRIITFFIFMGLFSASYQIGAMSEVDEESALEILADLQEVLEDIDAIGIFLHNTAISLAMFIPGAGVVWGFYAGYSTGYAFAALASLIPEIAEIPPLALLWVSPFGFMELVAYSLGTSRSYILIFMIIKKINLRSAIIPTTIEIGILIGLLVAGAVLEDYVIANEIQLPGF